MKRLLKPELYPVISALLTAIIFLFGLALLGIIGFGNYTILWGDLAHQYVPFIKLFMSSLTRKTDYWYSFSLYLGSCTALTYAYYGLSPFNLLYLADFLPETLITVAVITLKLSLAAASFQYYEKKALKLQSPLSILFSLCYALSGFTAGMYINIIWLDTLYTLPLLSCFTLTASRYTAYKVTEKHSVLRLFILLTLSFAYLFFTNFYMGFIAGIFEFLLFIISYFGPGIKRSIKDFIRKSAFFCAALLLASALCAVTHVPAAYFLFSHMAQDNIKFQDLTATIPDIINAFFIGSFQGINNSIPILYCGLPVLLLFPFFFLSGKISHRIKVLSAIMLIYYLACMLILPLYKFMHAFDYPNYYGYRFSFCICFILISMSAYTLENSINTISHKAYAVYTTSLIVLYSIMIPLCEIRYSADQSGNSTALFLVNVLFLSAYLMLFMMKDKIKHSSAGSNAPAILKAVFSILVIAELTINVYASGLNRGNAYETALDNWLTEGPPINNIQSQDDSFYRISVKDEVISNAPAWFNYAGLNTFSSSDDYNLRHALHDLGIVAPNREIYDIGYTPVTYALTGTKYYITNNPQEDAIGNHTDNPNTPAKVSTENDTYLPLLFMCNKNIMNYSPESDPFVNQNELISCLYGKDCHFFSAISQNDIFTGRYNAEMVRSNDQICFIRENTIYKDMYYIFAVPHDDSRIFYACFLQEESHDKQLSTQILCDTIGSIKPVTLAMGSIATGCTLDSETNKYIINASPDQIYDGICVYTDNPAIESDTCQDVLLYEYKTENSLKEICDDLSSTAPTITSFRSSDIKATVHVTDDRPILFTTIPYDEGWSIYCDGKEVETIATVENAFLGAELPEGDHEIELKYTARFAKEGLIISLLGTAILSVIIIISLLQRREHADSQKDIAP